jgi:NOL1/NOP2/sun family putative RNA methylase
MNEKLPVEFLERMKEQLGDEYPDFLNSYNIKGRRGIRINELKTTAKEIKEQAPFSMEPVPWVSSGYFIDENDDPAGHPFYRAGLYYIQEPSAMTPADRLDIIPGEKVLDLCAAPGGKATALAVKLKGEGLLVANDASASRCRALLHNLELFGAGNIIVTNEQPAKLEKKFPEFFDKILVDAPCSGEGMFRKEPEVIGSWTPERVEYFSALQKSILKSAVKMLKPGGMMMYSTCTFSKEENEGSVSFVLDEFPDMQLMEIKSYEGFSKGRPEWGNKNLDISKTVRI